MGIWVGYLGAGDESRLNSLLGDRAQSHVGAGFGLGVHSTGGDPATLTITANQVTAGIAAHANAGSSGSAHPSDETLTLVRDPFGFHGAYATHHSGAWWCSSNYQTLLRLPEVPGQLHASALHAYLCFSYVPIPLTLTPDIDALPAGQQVVLSESGQVKQSKPAWSESEPSDLSEERAVAELRERLRKAVQASVSPGDEVGIFLSGGLDSSIIAALLVEIGVKVHLFTLDFGPPFDAELPYAQLVAQHLERPLNKVLAHPPQIRDALLPTAAALDQPFGDGVTVPLYLLGQAAAQQVSVVFNGEGGDQLFGGWANKPMIAAELYGGEGYDREEAYLATYHKFHGLAGRFYTPAARALVENLDVGQWMRPALNAGEFSTFLHRLRAANLLLKGAQNILPRATQLAEAHGLRMRAPFSTGN